VTVRVARVRSPGRTAASIRKGITSKLGAFRRCYRKLVGKRPRAGGEIELRFIVHTSGKVVSALVFRSTLGDPGAERCVRSVMRRVEVASIEEVTVARAVLVFRR
jgi:outer membrane biosynthesis protein TonB